jgi:hypothetical protein
VPEEKMTSPSISPTTPETCIVKILPAEVWADAARKSIEVNPANALPGRDFALALPNTVIPPEHLALLTGKRWPASGVRLTVGFLDSPPDDLKARLLSHMNAWSQFANVRLVETSSNPQVRVARTAGKGYWSYLGTDILSIPADQQTMNLDSFTMSTADSEFHRVVRHETGHTLGFPHEHTRSDIVNRIDREKAIAYFMRTQGWSRDQVIAQVLTPLDNSALIATAHADPTSIMCYWLPASIMTDGVAVTGGTDIDSLDAQFAAQLYPSAVPMTGVVHLQEIGDVPLVNDQFCGTRGQSRRLEGFEIRFNPPIQGLSMRYMAHLQDVGDVPYQNEGTFIGTRGQSRRLEGFAIELTGPQASSYSISYMAHLQDIGDTQLYSNGAFCGTRGQSRRVEGMLVHVGPRPG